MGMGREEGHHLKVLAKIMLRGRTSRLAEGSWNVSFILQIPPWRMASKGQEPVGDDEQLKSRKRFRSGDLVPPSSPKSASVLAEEEARRQVTTRVGFFLTLTLSLVGAGHLVRGPGVSSEGTTRVPLHGPDLSPQAGLQFPEGGLKSGWLKGMQALILCSRCHPGASRRGPLSLPGRRCFLEAWLLSLVR